jgi:hypothetical protein
MANPKFEILNPKQTQISKIQNSKVYDLRDRTLRFAKRVRDYVKNLPKTLSNIEDAKQLIKASGSVGKLYRGRRSAEQEGFCNENKDIKERGKGEWVLA